MHCHTCQIWISKWNSWPVKTRLIWYWLHRSVGKTDDCAHFLMHVAALKPFMTLAEAHLMQTHSASQWHLWWDYLMFLFLLCLHLTSSDHQHRYWFSIWWSFSELQCVRSVYNDTLHRYTVCFFQNLQKKQTNLELSISKYHYKMNQ